MNKIIKDLNIPGGTTRAVVIKRKSPTTPTAVEIQFQLDLPEEVVSEPTNNKE